MSGQEMRDDADNAANLATSAEIAAWRAASIAVNTERTEFANRARHAATEMSKAADLMRALADRAA